MIYAAGPVVPQVHLSKIPPQIFSKHLNSEVNAFWCCYSFTFIRKQNGAIIAVTSAATDKYPIKDGLSASPKAAIEILIKGLAKRKDATAFSAMQWALEC